MKKVTATQGQTWDMPAKIYMGDEVFTREVMMANCEMSDTVIFNGGETVNIPESTDIDEELL